jgi:hypothetical protein
MDSLYIHYKNKYPNGRVMQTDTSLDVFNSAGEHVVALRKNGAQQMVCVSEAMGLRDKHCLAPIPKDSRVHKLVEGKVSFDDKAEERMKLKDNFLCPEREDVILSCAELTKNHKMVFDEKQKLQKD